jgi:predicted enzyme related to lactoylglutathione lyase
MSHPFTYCELHTEDPARAKAFYAELFAWKMSDSPSPVGPYTEIHPGEGIEAGLMKKQSPAAPSHWLTYIRVPDLDAAMKRARDLGGALLVDRSEVPDTGWFCVMADPVGAVFGMFQSMK